MKSLYLSVVHGHVQIKNNNFNIDNQKISLVGLNSLNVTNNVFEKKISKSMISDSFLEIENHVDTSISDYIDFDSSIMSDFAENYKVKGNIFRLSYG